MINRENLLTITFWVALAIIAIWLFLKATGIVNSPIWFEYVPYAGAIFVAGTAFQMVKDTKDSLKALINRVNKIAEGLTKLEIEFRACMKKR